MIQSHSPQQPSDLVAEIAAATPERVGEAAADARAAQADWWQGPAAGRSQALSAAADAVAGAAEELTDLVVREVGKPLGEARGEVGRSVAILRYYAQQVFDPVGSVHEPSGSGLLFTRRHPRGVAGLITPWNFPLAIPLWKGAPALAFGNSVLLKPAPEATACALRLAELLGPALPEGLLTVLPGDAEAGAAVVAHADVVSFTGSIAAGRSVATAATERGIPVQAEMGGQNPAVVLPDADVEAAAQQVASAAMGYAGQKCTATKRVIVVGDGGPFREAFVSAVASLQNGDPGQSGVTVGPVISEAARDNVLAAAEDARRAGGNVLTGGVASERDGWFVEPTVVEGVPEDHRLACDEVFGPICLLQSAADLDDAVRIANAVPHGLAAAVYTRDVGVAVAAGDRLDAGLVKVNAPTSGVDFYLPFGGEKASSLGQREQG
ncbi:MAG: aldehyde dehydrogenase family protein, partial [Nocardioidaceae bacterium]